MLGRCFNPKRRGWAAYGGRGITVVDRWLEFAAFLEDMGPMPPGYTIERNDNDKPYAPENCRWATKDEQGRNRRNNHRLTFGGQTKLMSEWAKEYGLLFNTLWNRIHKAKWDIERALTSPLREWPSAGPTRLRGKPRVVATFTHDGKTLTLREWSIEVGIPLITLRNRLLAYRWNTDRALTTQVKDWAPGRPRS